MRKTNPCQSTVGIDARMLGAEQTGIGKYIARLIEYIPPLMPEVQFVAFLREPEFSRFRSLHTNVEKQKVSAHWYGYAEQFVLPLQLLRAGIDLMHFPHFNVPVLYPGKFVVTIHDLTPRLFPGPRMSSWWHREMFRLVFSRALKKSRRIIAVSQFTKNDIMHTFGTADEKILLVPEGVDEVFFRKPSGDSREALRDRYGIIKPFMLYVGVWREHKNIVGLIRAYHMLLGKYDVGVDLVLCGREHASYPEPRQLWEKLGIGKRIHHPGFIVEEDLPHFYRAAMLTVVPSFSEGFGFTGLESLAAGTPVAASRATSLPEVLGDAAAYFDPHDQQEMASVIYQALTDTKLRTNLLRASEKVLERYNWKSMAACTAALYRDMLKKS